ncbi:anaphase-promoting complex subunit 15B-like [Cylas formicarius]|uniref:anaphase-promoting complex subunit 15B-like n=1 Tax=Cylas formicarius TaxID=197179 RepID=UPI00295864CE|nr:anaphase-promoting complex subunit 15B-like [Cylas formicarius]
MSIPLFPKCLPRFTDPNWFDVDQPCADEDEISQLEKEHQDWIEAITLTNSDSIPIGKTNSEAIEDDEDEDDEDDNDDDDDSDSHDDDEEEEIEIDPERIHS